MFVAGKTTPKIGEIRLGYVEAQGNTHKYTGVHPYLVVSNNVYNQKSGQTEVIPFTTKRMYSHNPVHVNFKVGEVNGLTGFHADHRGQRYFVEYPVERSCWLLY